jgi:hypothetical protein
MRCTGGDSATLVAAGHSTRDRSAMIPGPRIPTIGVWRRSVWLVHGISFTCQMYLGSFNMTLGL